MALADATSGLRNALQNLTAREQRLIAILGAVLLLLAVVLPLYLLTNAIGTLEDEATQYSDALREIDRARDRIAAIRRAADAAERRYRSTAPPLRTFLTRAAELESITIERVEDVDQPGRTAERAAEGFHRRQARADMRGVALRPALNMLASMENGDYPVAIERIDISRNSGADQYTLKLGIVAFDRVEATKAAATTTARAASPSDPRNGVGPPEALP